MTVELLKSGGRRVHFYVPQELVGKKLEHIDIDPCRLDQLLRWQDGQIESSMMLLSELTRHTETELRCLTFPDADRVMNAFLEVVPEAIRDDIAGGRKPVSTPLEIGPERTIPGMPDAEWRGSPDPEEPSPAEAQDEALRRATGDEDGTGLDIMGDRS